jgi:hypothetical protein
MASSPAPACRTFFPHIGLAEARRYGEGGWATNLGRSTCITGVRLITETIGGGIACQIHMLAKTRFHLNIPPSLHSAL